MAYDFTLNSGNRLSRGRRTQSEQIDVGDTSASMSPVAQKVPTPIMDDHTHQIKFWENVGKFFGERADAARKEELDDEKKRNAEALLKANNLIQQNPEKARDAMQTGDFSFFVPDDELRQRKIIQENFSQMVGLSDARMDYDAEGRNVIQQTPEDGDPRAAVAAYLKTQLNGANPFYSAAYTGAFQKAAEKDVNAFIDARQKAVALKAEATFASTVEGAISDGSVRTVQDIETLVSRGAGAIPGVPTPMARQHAEAIIETKLIQATTSDNDQVRERAIRLINTPDPKRDGTSIASRNKMDMQKIIGEAVTARRNGQALGISAQVTILSDKVADGTLSPGAALTKLESYRRNKGVSSRNADYVKFRDELLKQTAKTAYVQEFVNMPPGHLPGGSKDFEKARTEIWNGVLNGTVPAAMAQRYPNYSPEQLTAGIMQRLQAMGAPANFREYLATHLNDPDNAKKMAQFVSQWKAAGGQVEEVLGTGPDGMKARALVDLVEANPQGFEDIYRGLTEAAKMFPSGTDPRASFNATFKDGTGTQRAALGANKARNMLNSIISDARGPDGEKMSIDSGMARRASDYLQTLHYLRTGMGIEFNESELTSMVSDWVRKNSITVYGGDGETKMIPVPADLPKNAVVSNGKGGFIRKPIKYLPAHEVEVLSKRVMDGSLGGNTKGAHGAEPTAHGYRMRAANGDPMSMRAGSRHNVHTKDIPDALVRSGLFNVEFKGQIDKDDEPVVEMSVRGPGEDFKVDDNVWAHYDKESGNWGLYLREDPTKPTTPSEVSNKHAEDRNDQFKAMDYRKIQTLSGDARRKAIMDFAKKYGVSDRQRAKMLGEWVPLGTPNAAPAPSNTPAQSEAVKQVTQGALSEALADGSITPDVAMGIHGELKSGVPEALFPKDGSTEDLAKSISEYLAEAMDKGNAKNNETTSPAVGSEGFTKRTLDFIEGSEGFVPFAYDDERRSGPPKPWSQSKKRGKPTVGFGFNLSRKDARQKIAAIGLDYDKVLKGEQSLNRKDAERLFALDMKDITSRLRKDFPDVPWTEHRLMALVSLAIHGGYDTFMGPKTKTAAALKRGDFAAVEREIRHNSIDEAKMMRTGRGHLIPSFMLRRNKEADTWIGVGNEDDPRLPKS